MVADIFFYAEADETGNFSKSTGLGHIFRLYPIFVLLKEKYNSVRFFLPISSARLKQLGINEVDIIDPGEPALTELLNSYKPKIVVLDGYGIVKSIIPKLMKYPDLKVVLFDDHYDLNSLVDTVINTAPLATSRRYKQNIANTFLTGLNFSPISHGFVSAREIFSIRRNIKRIILALGGNDALGNIESVTEALSSSIPDSISVDVIGENLSGVNQPMFNYIGWKSQSELASISGQYDLAILAGGSMLHQFACVGVPILCWPQTGNQLKHAESWHSRNAIHLVKTEGDLTSAFEKIKNRECRKLLSDNSRMLIDGLGAERVAAHISTLL